MSILSAIGEKILSVVKNVGILVTIAMGLLLIASAYCGYISPEISAKFALFGMTFPVFLTIECTILAVWLVVRKWQESLLTTALILACYPTLITFAPCNISFTSATPADSTFTLLTYNVMNFDDYENKPGENRTLRYILDQDADFVILQEASAKVKMNELEQIGDLMPEVKKKYPYREERLRDVVILSKYPYLVENETLNERNRPYKKSAAYKVNVNGKTLHIIGVHLESLRLTENDKALYRDITDITKSTSHFNEKKVEDVKSGILTKLATAFRVRAEQAKELRQYIDSVGENVILCGDFNDTPSSFAYNTIMGDDMSDAYKECGFGPTITFHHNRFYFRIDHVLYKGDFEAVRLQRGSQKSSDHYPLLTTFRWTK